MPAKPQSEDPIIFYIKGQMVTAGAAAFGPSDRRRFQACKEAILKAVRESPDRNTLAGWLKSKRRLSMTVCFKLNVKWHHDADLDNLLGTLFNSLVEGACGTRPRGKPIPQNYDKLIWELHASKVEGADESTLVMIHPM